MPASTLDLNNSKMQPFVVALDLYCRYTLYQQQTARECGKVPSTFSLFVNFSIERFFIISLGSLFQSRVPSYKSDLIRVPSCKSEYAYILSMQEEGTLPIYTSNYAIPE